MSVDAKTVKELREKTGLPMMECKRALEKTEGDVEKAIDELRKGGAKAVEKLHGRKADQGRIASHVSADGKLGALVCLRCETEPVANNEDFVAFTTKLVQVVVAARPADTAALLAARIPGGGTVQDGVTDLVNRLRENISVGRFAVLEADSVAQYVHFDNRHAAMVAFSGGSQGSGGLQGAAGFAELGKGVCMHIVFSKPMFLSRNRFDQKLIAKEREICLAAAKNDPKNAKKNDEILGKIVEGQINKFVAERCLLEQEYIKDDQKRSVEKCVAAFGGGAKVLEFAYIATDLD